MRIKKLTIENISSIEKADICFDDCGLVFITGYNYDADRQNGCGKTSILNSIPYVLYGDYPRNVSITDFVRRDSKKSCVYMELEIDNVRYSIKRARPGGFSCVDENSNQISEIEFLNKLKISYQQYMLTAYTAQGQNDRFLFLNDSSRKDLILKLMQANSFQEAKEKVDLDIKNIDNKINTLSSSMISLNSKIDAWKDSIIDITTLEKQIKDIEKAIANNKILISQFKDIEKPDTAKYNDAINKLYNQINTNNKNINELSILKRQLCDLRNKLPPVDSCDAVCPHCNTELDIIRDKLTLHDSDSVIKKIKEFDDKKNNDISNIEQKMSDISLDLKDNNIINNTIKSLQNKIEQISQEYNEARIAASDLTNKNINHNNTLSTIKSDIEKNNNIVSNIEKAKNTLTALEIQKQESEYKLLSLKAVQHLFSSTGVPAYILESVIDMFNEKIQSYMSAIWPQSSFELQSFKENKSGQISAKISDNLCIDGSSVPVMSISGGEQRCLALAVDMALLEVVEQYTGVRLSHIILDEPFTGLDSVTKVKIMELLQQIASDRLVLIVDHTSETQSLSDKIIRIEKRDKVSRIVG